MSSLKDIPSPYKVTVIHSSEIIRKGLVSVIQSCLSVYSTQLQEYLNLNEVSLSKKEQHILFIETLEPLPYEHLSILKDNYPELILIGVRPSLTDPEPDPIFDTTICMCATACEINDILSKINQTSLSQDIEQDTKHKLTDREKDVLKLVALGLLNKQIADKLSISVHTVITHRKKITEKLSIKSISGLTIYAILNGLIDTNMINDKVLI